MMMISGFRGILYFSFSLRLSLLYMSMCARAHKMNTNIHNLVNLLLETAIKLQLSLFAEKRERCTCNKIR